MEEIAKFIRTVTRPSLTHLWLVMTFAIIWTGKHDGMPDAMLISWMGLGIGMIGWWFYERTVSKIKATP